jgi:purine-nucleoside phosphorylase
VRLVLVPQGAEFAAVQRGWQGRSSSSPDRLLAIPAGIVPVKSWLQTNLAQANGTTSVIVMGLCGALNPQLKLGEPVIYQTCQTLEQLSWQCLSEFDQKSISYAIVNAVTTDRVITTVADKQSIYRSSQCDVVDMEGSAIAQFFQAQNLPVTMVRVVGDDLGGDLPDLSQAFDADGQMQPWALAGAMLQSPIGALRLIRGSLLGLRQLTRVARTISS